MRIANKLPPVEQQVESSTKGGLHGRKPTEKSTHGRMPIQPQVKSKKERKKPKDDGPFSHPKGT